MPRYSISYTDSHPESGGGGKHELSIGEYINTPTDQQIRDLADYMAANLNVGPGGPATITLTSITRLDLSESITLNP